MPAYDADICDDICSAVLWLLSQMLIYISQELELRGILGAVCLAAERCASTQLGDTECGAYATVTQLIQVIACSSNRYLTKARGVAIELKRIQQDRCRWPTPRSCG